MLFNACLLSACLPEIWKKADICPIPKTSPRNLSETRPIAKLPIPERIFEKCLLKRIKFEFLSRYDAFQFGFRPRSSTTCALIDVQNFICSMLDKPNVLACHICALDLTKSFDRLSHKLLIEKMIRDNFSPFVINFVSNYLSNRTQRVKWNNELSRIVSATSGVPQGSSFGPLLFAYFMSDFACDSFQNCLVVKYADDVTLCGVISSDTSDSTLLSLFFLRVLVS